MKAKYVYRVSLGVTQGYWQLNKLGKYHSIVMSTLMGKVPIITVVIQTKGKIEILAIFYRERRQVSDDLAMENGAEKNVVSSVYIVQSKYFTVALQPEDIVIRSGRLQLTKVCMVLVCC